MMNRLAQIQETLHSKGKNVLMIQSKSFIQFFCTEHYHKGNRFEIQMESVCIRKPKLPRAKNYAKSQGKSNRF